MLLAFMLLCRVCLGWRKSFSSPLAPRRYANRLRALFGACELLALVGASMSATSCFISFGLDVGADNNFSQFLHELFNPNFAASALISVLVHEHFCVVFCFAFVFLFNRVTFFNCFHYHDSPSRYSASNVEKWLERRREASHSTID
jgi:hypothetical protein